MKPLVQLARSFRQAANRARSLAGRRIYLASDGGNWAIDGVANAIAEGVASRGVTVGRVRELTGFRRQILHAFDCFSFFREELHRRVHPSNDLFLTWMHVEPATSTAERERLHRDVSEAAQRLRGIIVPCELTRRDLIALGADPSRLPVLPLGVDTVLFRPPTPEQRRAARMNLGVPDDAFLIGSFLKDGQGWGDGNEPKLIKGPDVFLAVLERVAREHKNLFVLLTAPARGFVKAGLSRLGIPFVHRNVKDYRRMVDLYHALDLCLITSRCEGGPLSFAESWATGVPTVSTRVGIAEDLTVQGENGFVANIDDDEALAAFVSALVADPALRRRCADRALRDVGPVAWSEIARRHFDELYAPLLG